MAKGLILIVEDEALVNELMGDYLEAKGYDTISTDHGNEAMQMVGEHKPDIMFLDIQLNDGVDGMTVLKKAREISPESKIIMMSAYKDKYGPETEKLGAYAFLSKPIQVTSIGQILDDIEAKSG